MSTKVKIALIVGAALVLLVIGVVGGRAWRGRQVHKAYEQYHQEKAEWDKTRAGLIARAEAHEQRIAELEPQVVAYKAAAEEGKRLDESKVKAIEELGKKEAQNEATANQPTECGVRAQRICDMFRSTDRNFDCTALFDQCKRPR